MVIAKKIITFISMTLVIYLTKGDTNSLSVLLLGMILFELFRINENTKK